MSKSRDNPFPGMNPYAEGRWQNVHARMLTYIAAQLQRQLPDDLITEVEQDLKVGSQKGDATYEPDIAIREPWSGDSAEGGAAVLSLPVGLAKPIALAGRRPQRRIAIMDTRGHLITVVELLSPSNKNGGRTSYEKKRNDFIGSGVNLVEIDLVREGGIMTTLFEDRQVTKELGTPPAPHVILVYRGHGLDQHCMYPVRYQERLPRFAVPLRLIEPDVALDLQAVMQQCFDDAALWHANYSQDPDPPLSPEDSKWLDQLLKSRGLR